MSEELTVLHATKQVAPGTYSLAIAAEEVYTLSAWSAERSVEQPARIALYWHKRCNHRSGRKKSHARGCYVGRLAQFGIGLHRGVARLLEPSRVLATLQVGKDGMDALVDTSVLLCRLVIDRLRCGRNRK